MDLESVKIAIPAGSKVILRQTHFIKGAEDIFEALANSVHGLKFGLAFCEASGPCLVRHEGTDENLRKMAGEKALEIGAGHVFLIYSKDAYPLNVLNAVKNVPEVCNIFCATTNPVNVILAESEQGRGVNCEIDSYPSKEIEAEKGIRARKDFLRKIGYKLN